MADAMQKVTYSEDPDTVAWVDDLARQISEYRDGAPVSRADVLRLFTRVGRDFVTNRTIEQLAARV